MQSTNLLTQSFEDVNLNISMAFTKKDRRLVHRILRDNFALLEEQSLRFHEAIKEILEQIVFHREQIGVQERDIYIPKIQNFQERMKEFNQEYKRMLRKPMTRGPI
jgi:hypothetical protein